MRPRPRSRGPVMEINQLFWTINVEKYTYISAFRLIGNAILLKIAAEPTPLQRSQQRRWERFVPPCQFALPRQTSTVPSRLDLWRWRLQRLRASTYLASLPACLSMFGSSLFRIFQSRASFGTQTLTLLRFSSHPGLRPILLAQEKISRFLFLAFASAWSGTSIHMIHIVMASKV